MPVLHSSPCSLSPKQAPVVKVKTQVSALQHNALTVFKIKTQKGHRKGSPQEQSEKIQI